jgi:hypothetical protein
LPEEIMATLSLPVPDVLRPNRAALWRAGMGIVVVLGISLAIGLVTLSVRGGNESAWYAAAENVSRFSALVFLGFFVSGSLSYFVPSAWSRAMGNAEETLLLAFVGAYATYLAFIVARVWFTDTRTPLETITFCVFAAIVPALLALTAHRQGERQLDDTGWGILRRAGIIYFWLVFAIGGFGHFYGPHRPDPYFGVSVLLLTGGLFMRVIAAFGRRVRIARTR